jgi:hypothetical protein
MSCSTRSTFRLSAARVSWGVLNQVCVTPVTGLVGGEYFTISSLGTEYYVWFDLDNSSVDPAPVGLSGIEVDLATGYTVDDARAAMEAAIEAVQESGVQVFDAYNSGGGLTVRMKNVGPVVSAAADVDSGFTVETTRAGIGGDLGATQGGVEVAFEVTTTDITADQTGTSIRDRIIQGVTATATMSLLEMDPDKWELVVGQYAGGVYTPAGGSKVVGFGESKNFASSFENGGILNLHPLDRADSDRSEDISFWISTPVPASYNFSGEEVSLMELEFTALPDRTKRDEINIMCYGDYLQALDA